MKSLATALILLLLAWKVEAQHSVAHVDSLISTGDLEAASLAASEAIARTEGELQLRYYNKQAEIFIQQGKLPLAEQILIGRMPVAETSKSVLAEWKTTVGFFYLNRARNDMALENLQQALQLFHDAGKDKSLEAARCLSTLSFAYLAEGKMAQAEENGLAALRIREQLLPPASEDMAASYNDLGLIYGQSNPDKALEYYDMAMAVYEKLHGKTHRKIAIAYNNIGLAYRNLKLYGDAINNFEAAESIWKTLYPNGHPNQAFSLVNLGLTYAQMRNNGAAKDYFTRALAIYRNAYGERHSDIAAVLNQLGILDTNDGAYDAALAHFQEALIANTPSFSSRLSTANPPINSYYNAKVLLYSLRLKAEALESRHLNKTLRLTDLTMALSTLQSCDSLIENIRFGSSNEADKLEWGASASDVYESGVRVAQAISEMTIRPRSYEELAFFFAEKSKSAVLQESIADAEAKSYAGIPNELLEKEKQLKATLSLLIQQLSQKPAEDREAALRQQLFEATRDYEAFERNLEATYPDYYNLKFNRATPSLDQVQRQLREGQVLVSYFVAEKSGQLYSFVITPSRLRLYRSTLPPQFEGLVKGFTNGIYYHAPDVFHDVARPLSRLLLRGVPKAEETIIIPAGRLSTLPFEALIVGKAPKTIAFESFRYLLQQTAVSYEFSAGLLLQKSAQRSGASKPIFLCAPITFPEKDNLADLPATQQEVKSISSLFGKESFVALGPQANESLVKSGALSDYRYLHFATHGIVDEESPALSRIFLQETDAEDGNIFSGEIFNLKLNADLAVLSACETGLGKYSKGEGVIGLSRALVYAGARSIVVSYWRVADESTAELMTEFYRQLVGRPNVSPRVALQEAKMKLRDQLPYSAPFYWAPFVLIGQ
ncbi:MAG: CHAT domain-containing protein [Cyclobacteriaceae bacterium]|nr:CHAT domain-containing protein [Cyclobacteriaceae bacterium]